MTEPDFFADATDGKPEPTKRMVAWVKRSTIYRLSRRMMTEHELVQAISRKAKEKFEDISEDEIEALTNIALEFGRSLQVLDDKAYADIKRRSSIASGKSKRGIARKLAEKGVDRALITETLADTDDLLAAMIFARKRGFGPFRRLDADEKRRAKELSAFARNGFSFELAQRVLSTDREDAEELIAEGRAL